MTKEERCRAAKAYREKGLNCAQCLLATFRDVAGLTEQQALGGGVRCGGICGAVSAPVLILGASCPDPSDRPHTTKLTKEFESRFAERFHRLDCRELLPAQDLEPSELAQELAAAANQAGLDAALTVIENCRHQFPETPYALNDLPLSENPA